MHSKEGALSHGRVDGSIPDAKLREFEQAERASKSDATARSTGRESGACAEGASHGISRVLRAGFDVAGVVGQRGDGNATGSREYAAVVEPVGQAEDALESASSASEASEEDEAGGLEPDTRAALMEAMRGLGARGGGLTSADKAELDRLEAKLVGADSKHQMDATSHGEDIQWSDDDQGGEAGVWRA